MGRIENYIAKRSKDKAVYWGSPTHAADGQLTFTTVSEIDCLWMDQTDIIKDDQGMEIISRATVFVSQDLDEQGMLYKGNLSDLTAAQKSDPHLLRTAYEIVRFVKTPSLSDGGYSRKALL